MNPDSREPPDTGTTAPTSLEPANASWDPELILRSLAGSRFRSRQRLGDNEWWTLRHRGMDAVLDDAREFLVHRIAPAVPRHDGRQTPMHGHPAFVAQHATATCCRSCIARWYHIPTGRALTDTEIDSLLDMLRRWFLLQPPPPEPSATRPASRTLFPEIDEKEG